MFIKVSAVAIAALQVASFVEAAKKSNTTSTSSKLDKPQDYYKSWKSQVDPTNITIPAISQTTSTDPVAECAYYSPTNFEFNEKEWPNIWETATSNGMDKTAEFVALYNSIDWTKAPSIKPRKLKSDGSIDMSSYDQSKDPDCWWSASTCTIPKIKDVNADIYTCNEPETWGLTYDDGPNCSHNAFYDYLEEQNLKASMFYIGSNVVDWPYGAQRGVKAGHHIADHTWSHQLMTTLSNKEVLAELYYTQKAIKMVTGVTPLHWRPAMGDVDDRVRWIATQLNLTAVIWDRDTDDWAAGSSKTVEEVEKTYEEYIEMGSNGTYANKGQITLTHEIDNTTMSLALKYLPKVQTAYKHVIDVATCMNITQPYQESSITFPTFDEYLQSAGNATSGASNATSTTSGDAAGTTNIDLTGADLKPTANGVVAAAAASTAAAAAAVTVDTAATSVPAAAMQQAATSAGFQITPNGLALAAAAVAAIVF
ncbi:chitin deacetylase [Choanephora cucurbitarum]|nr:chitin deacetylase [Choanephora cucurbitarum]